MAQQIPSDALLLQVAERAHTRDWNVLVKKLDLSPDEITSIERQNQDDEVIQVQCKLYYLTTEFMTTWYLLDPDANTWHTPSFGSIFFNFLQFRNVATPIKIPSV